MVHPASSVAEEDGCDWGGGGGGGGGGAHVYHNRDLLKDCHARGGGHVPLVPPWFRHLCSYWIRALQHWWVGGVSHYRTAGMASIIMYWTLI